MSIHGMKTTKPDASTRSAGGGLPTATAQVTNASGLSKSATGVLGTIFPKTPYLDGYDLEDGATLAVVGNLLHGTDAIPAVPGWANAGTNLDFDHADIPDQTAIDKDNLNKDLPQPAYAPFADAAGTVDPHIPTKYNEDPAKQPDGLKVPDQTSTNNYHTLSDYLTKTGVGFGINNANGS